MTQKKSYRTEKVADTIQKNLSILMRREMDDQRLNLVSLSGVEVSKDLAHAKVYFSVLGDEDKVKAAQEALDSAAKFLRGLLAKSSKFRTTPELHFFHDASFEYGEKMDALILKAKSKDNA